MRLSIWIGCAAALLTSCGKPEPPQDLPAVFRSINSEVLAHSVAYDKLKEATSAIGHRLTGSENGARAEEYAFRLLQEFGFKDVRFQPFEVTAWQRDSVSLIVNTGSKDVPLATVSLANTPEQASCDARIVDMGSGLAKDFEFRPGEAQGNIVLMNLQALKADSAWKNLHRSEKTALAIKYGAVGVIFVNDIEGEIRLTGTASPDGKPVAIPAVCISREDGLMLREALARGNSVKAHIYMRNRIAPIQARNIVARLEGATLPEERILIGGHLDCWDLATGAIDNGIGSFSVLDIARTFMALNLRPKRTIEFVMFMGEEQGLLGSRAMSEKLAKEGRLSEVRYMLNLDMAGNTKGFGLCGRTEMKHLIDSVGAIIRGVDTLFQNKIDSAAGLHSDHQPFMMRGVPVLGNMSNMDRTIYKCYHSECDEFSLVNKDHMVNCIRFTGMMLYGIADAKHIPARLLSEEETGAFLEKHKLREELEVAGEWRWK